MQKNKKQESRRKNIKQWIGILGVFALSFFTSNFNFNYLKTSVIIQVSPEFDGTVHPIQQVPDWTNFSINDKYTNFHDYPSTKLISIPEYRNDYFTFPSSNLVWGNKSHDVIRNTKITYPVPYAGSYALDDGGEHHGSHPAVDIKALAGTPVHAIANALVYKVGNQSGGFGNYVVLRHDNVPNPNNPDSKTTVYSGYAHLSKVFITEGQTIYKNDIIGEVGTTGASTTNHLHFQLDNSLAPWHLYWPFTTTDVKNAGLSFWEGVSAGIGKDNVYKYTYNPVEWVQDHLETQSVIAGSATSSSNLENSAVESINAVEETVIQTQSSSEVSSLSSVNNDVSLNSSDDNATDDIESSVVTVGFENIKLDGTNFIIIGNNQSFDLNLTDSSGEIIENPNFDGELALTVSDSNLAQVSPSSLVASDFEDGIAKIKVYANREGTVKINASITTHSYESAEISLITQVKPFARFGIFSDGDFVPKRSEEITIQALDENGNPTPSFNAGGTIRLSFEAGNGSFSKEELSKDDFESGTAKVTFTAEDDSDVIIQSKYGMAKAESDLLHANLFSDINKGNSFYNAVSYLYKKGTVQGYPDGSFQDERTVSRVEALKFIYSGFDKSILEDLTFSYSDASEGQWYSNYVATASTEGIIQGYPDGSLRPEQGVNRVEFLKMLTRALGEEVDPVVTEDPYSDVDKLAWYAPYVQFSKLKNIFPLDVSIFEPSKAMSRGEVAEVIYRMLVLKQTNEESYSVLLKPLN